MKIAKDKVSFNENQLYSVRFNGVFLKRLQQLFEEIYYEYRIIRFSKLDYLLEFVKEILNRTVPKNKEERDVGRIEKFKKYKVRENEIKKGEIKTMPKFTEINDTNVREFKNKNSEGEYLNISWKNTHALIDETEDYSGKNQVL